MLSRLKFRTVDHDYPGCERAEGWGGCGRTTVADTNDGGDVWRPRHARDDALRLWVFVRMWLMGRVRLCCDVSSSMNAIAMNSRVRPKA